MQLPRLTLPLAIPKSPVSVKESQCSDSGMLTILRHCNLERDLVSITGFSEGDMLIIHGLSTKGFQADS